MSIIPTFYCDHCGHAFTHIDSLTGINRCPRCGNPNFELLINENSEKGMKVASFQPSIPAESMNSKTKRAIYSIALLAVGWILKI